MDRLEAELTELVEDRHRGEVVIREYKTGVAWAIARLARGWLIERARTAKLRTAVHEARMHVLRQLNGRHEQDREDAKAWLEKWGK